MRRRALLSTAAVFGAGCIGAGPGSTAESPAMTATGPASPTEAAYPTIPKPGDDCEAFDLPEATYPALPDRITESAAKRFATEFETAYAAARLESEPGTSVHGVDGGDAAVVDRTASGVLVRVRVALDFSAEMAGTEGTLAGSDHSRGWYFVTEEYVARARGDGSEEVPERGWVIVACGER